MTVLVAAVTLGPPDAGVNHTCAISSDSLAYCWGNTAWVNTGGQYGPAPRRVADSDSLRWVTLESGGDYACGLTPESELYCMGNGQFGQIGVEADSRPEPVRVALPAGVAAVGVGRGHSCAIVQDGRVFCWGLNASGELGSPSADQCWYVFPVKGTPVAVECSRTPLEAAVGLTFASVRAGAGLTCGRTTGAAIYCWGLHYGETPVLVDDTLGLDSLTMGGWLVGADSEDNVSLACGLDPAGAAWCWGQSPFGLGDGSTTASWSPIPVTGGLAFRALSAGNGVCGVTADGALYCWGGPPGFSQGATPTRVSGTLTFTSVTAGSWHGCGRAADERVYCWGNNADTKLGVDGPDATVPVRVLGQR
jgi:hypothetical protein